MATSFKTGTAYLTTPFGVLVNTSQGRKLVANGLNKRVFKGAEVLIGKNETGERIIASRRV